MWFELRNEFGCQYVCFCWKGVSLKFLNGNVAQMLHNGGIIIIISPTKAVNKYLIRILPVFKLRQISIKLCTTYYNSLLDMPLPLYATNSDIVLKLRAFSLLVPSWLDGFVIFCNLNLLSIKITKYHKSQGEYKAFVSIKIFSQQSELTAYCPSQGAGRSV